MSSTTQKTGNSYSAANLHPYQRKTVEFIKENPGAALFIDMGLGKTVSTLTALVDLFNSFDIAKVLVVAPLRVAVSTWPEEISKWAHTKDLTYSVLCGLEKTRKANASQDTQIHIINRENVVWLVQLFGKRWPYDVVVIDESSSFKSSSTKRFKALKKILPFTDRVIALTGTPASNGLLDLWSQIYLVDGGKRLGKTFSGYRTRFFESDYMGYNWSIREGQEDAIYSTISDICLTLSAEDYLAMPDRIDNQVTVHLPSEARKQYKELEKEFLVIMQSDVIAAVNAAALANKLLQISNGAVYTEDRAVVELHNAKLDALEEIIDGAQGQPVLVAYNYQHDMHRITKRFKNAVMLDKNPNTIKRWNNGEIQLLIAHPASAGHGLNLQRGGNIVVWFGLNWSLELYQQFNARLYRQGQNKPVIIHHIVADNTVDETVMAALARKDLTQRALLEALKNDATHTF